MKIAFVKQQNNLLPLYESDKKNYNKIVEGEIVEADFKKNRNLKHHRKYFAILKLVCSNSQKWQTVKQLHNAVKIKLGYYEIIDGLDGEKFILPDSIRFGVMEQNNFNEFYEQVIKLLADELKVSIADLENNYQDYL